MQRYKTKPCFIEAIQITDEDFTNPHPNKNHVKGVTYDPKERCVYIKTLEGVMRGNVGDYIVRGLEGELYPVKYSIFVKKYELAT